MGYQFYKSLLSGADPLFGITQKGFVQRRRDFDWSRWIDWRFDELQNPCAYGDEWPKKGKTHIQNYLKKNLLKYNYCRTYRHMKLKGYFNRPRPKPSDEYLNDKIPVHFQNLYDIKDMCEKKPVETRTP